MLVLSRRVGERLVIGKDIIVSIIDVRSDGVRIGIDAPREVKVTRAEILEAVEKQNAEAASVDDSAVEALKKLAPPKPAPKPAAAPKPGPPPSATS